MATTYNIGMSCQIVIDSTNDELSFTDSGSNMITSELTLGTYADIDALCTEIGTQMTADTPTADVYTAELVWDATYRCGKIKISNSNGNFILRGGASNGIRDIIGYEATYANKTGAATYTMDYQHQYGWYSNHGPRVDTLDRPIIGGGSPFLSRSGRTRRVVNPNVLHRRWISFDMQPGRKALAGLATGLYANQAFESLWLQAALGFPFTLYSDEDFTDEGTYSLWTPVDALDESTLKRLSPSADYYAINLELVKDES